MFCRASCAFMYRSGQNAFLYAGDVVLPAVKKELMLRPFKSGRILWFRLKGSICEKGAG
jgi:hypothetical protein